MSVLSNLLHRRKTLLKLPDVLSGYKEKALRRGASPDAARYLERMYLDGAIDDAVFIEKMENAIYVTDIPYLLEKFRYAGKEKEENTKRNYEYPAAFYGALFGDIAGNTCGKSCREGNKPDYGRYITGDSRPTGNAVLTLETAAGLRDIWDNGILVEERGFTLNDFAPDSTFPFRGNPFTVPYKNSISEAGFEDLPFEGSFRHWAAREETQPYGSCGNGSAARISPVPEIFSTQDDVILYSILSACATHNHYEGIKGAAATAVAAWMAYSGYDREAIFQYVKDLYKYEDNVVTPILQVHSFRMEELRMGTGPSLCSYSVPAAIVCFHESGSFGECISNVLSLDGDTGAIGAIAGTVAGAYYGVPEDARETVDEKCGSERFRSAEKFLFIRSVSD